MPGHHHDHHHHGHAHGMKGTLAWSLAGTMVLVIAEFLGSYWGRSIALSSDAVHNLTDLPPMILSLLALRWAELPPTTEKTYGFSRAGILSAFVNALLLGLAALYILYESWLRLWQPVAVQTEWMIGIALLALAINGGITLALVRGRRDLNLRSILIHNFGDALSNVAILAGALAMRFTGAAWVDPALGLGIGALVLWSSGGILRESTHVLLEGLPRGLRLEDVAHAILRVPGVTEVHDVHIWTLGTDLNALSCHVRIPDMHMDESQKILAAINELLAREFHITHSTVQFERAGLRQTELLMPEPVNAKNSKV
jgi:cobalt-zinc-cadmium efflux system protein